MEVAGAAGGEGAGVIGRPSREGGVEIVGGFALVFVEVGVNMVFEESD